MTPRLLIACIALLLAISACGDKKNAESTALAPSSGAGSNQSLLSGAALPTGGKVVKAMHAGGYTYMEIENAGKQFCVASSMMNVKQNDSVSWHDAAVMKNFKSTALHRDFDEILFVSAATVQ